MPFDPWSGQYYSADKNLDYTTQAGGQGTIGDGSVPVNNRPPQNNDPNLNRQPPPPGDTGSIGGLPFIGDGTVPTNTRPPAQPQYPNHPGYNPDLYRNAPAPAGSGGYNWPDPAPVPGNMGIGPQGLPVSAQSGPVGTGNPGTDRNNPPGTDLQNWFWSGTANHWVDSTGKRDATGRVLNPAEVAWWQDQDTQRAQATARGDRFSYTQPTPEVAGMPLPTAATANPAAATAQAQGQPGAAPKYDPLDPAWDYNGVQSVPWQVFLKNLFGENNANMQSFQEVKGVLDEARMKEAEKYGWMAAVPADADANTVYRAAIALAQQNPANDYTIVRLNVGGQPKYAALMREQDPNAQFARGYISPAKATELAQQRAAAEATARSRASSFSPRGTGPAGPPDLYTPPPPANAQLTQQQANGLTGILTHTLSPITQALEKAKAAAAYQQQQQNVRNAPYVPTQGTGASNVSYPARIPVGAVSPDGRMIWDGTQWTLREVDGGMGDGQHGSGKPDAYGGN